MIKPILITGASGFIGQYCVDEARRRGIPVRALVRQCAKAKSRWNQDDQIEIVELDLSRDSVESVLEGISAIIHAAASLAGDEEAMKRDTIRATRALLSKVPSTVQVVLVSSVAVYACDAATEGKAISEKTALETDLWGRDAYTRSKLAQESVARECQIERKFNMWIARPGAVYGPNRIWNSHIGIKIGPILLQMEHNGEIPIIRAETNAEALVKAAITPVKGIKIVNLLDSDLPDRDRFLKAINYTGPVFPLSWRVLMPVAKVLKYFPGVPGLLKQSRLRALMMPVRWDDNDMQDSLGPFTSTTDFESAVAIAMELPGKSRQ